LNSSPVTTQQMRRFVGVRNLLLALALTVAIVTLTILALGASPTRAAAAVVQGSLGNRFNVGQTAVIFGILSMTGLAAALPFTARLWNVGGEGQMIMGAIAAAVAGIALPQTLSKAVHLPIAVLAAVLAGAAYAAIPALLRAYRNTSEVVSSLMFNFVAVYVASWVIIDLYPSAGSRRTVSVSEAATFARPVPGMLADTGVLYAIGFIALAAVLMSRTAIGFRIRALGGNAQTSMLAGISTARTTLIAFVLGGSAAGFAGALVVLGRDQALQADFSRNFGYLGIAVALIARLRPALILPSALLLSVLRVGSNNLQAAAGLTPAMGEIVVATLIILLMVFGVIRFIYPEGSGAD
jgi:ABC-type uncharacterized transport system permease subunit